MAVDFIDFRRDSANFKQVWSALAAPSVLQLFENPEMINSSKQTSPSHRLERIIRGYDKVVYGNYLAENIGLNRIRERCPRFNAWVSAIQSLPENK